MRQPAIVARGVGFIERQPTRNYLEAEVVDVDSMGKIFTTKISS